MNTATAGVLSVGSYAPPDAPRPYLTPTERERIYSRIVKLENGCWHFGLRPTISRTGTFMFDDGRAHAVHRVIYVELTGRSLSRGTVLNPTCLDQECCNPEHQEETRRKPRPRVACTQSSILAHPAMEHLRPLPRLDVLAFLSTPGVAVITYRSGATMVISPWGSYAHNDGPEAAIRRALEDKT